MLVLSTAITAAALLVLIVAIRGRRLDDAPTCRRCGFDLSGLAGPGICPECGRELTSARRIRHGRRQRRPLLAASMAPICFAGVSTLAIQVWVSTANIDLTKYKPTWLLLRDLRGNESASVLAAMTELEGRASGAELSNSQLARAAVLSTQSVLGARSGGEDDLWSTIVAHALTQGALTGIERSAIFGEMSELEIQFDQMSVGEGGWVGVYVRNSARPRTSPDFDAATSGMRLDIEELEFIANDRQFTALPGVLHDGRPVTTLVRRRSIHHVWGGWGHVGIDTLPPGQWTGEFRWRGAYTLNGQRVPLNGSWPARLGIHADTGPVRFDPGMRVTEEVLSSIRITAGALLYRIQDDGDPDFLWAILDHTGESSVPLAYDITVRDGNQSWPFGFLYFANSYRHDGHIFLRGVEVQGDVVDLVFTPSPGVAAENNVGEAICGDEFTIRVPVIRVFDDRGGARPRLVRTPLSELEYHIVPFGG